ncbi:unnamed protein product [Bursaphelenchus xylophilus]|uniref:Protein NATD1 n=1 Tax=Bursaphelenchus xylophilus TaxID=6326 RepID=A0A1I7STN2_BURXY|nr:unnamed protein product [Bursaphelenchus xylophilus]CAG9108188.1 unnamed protein product [Bursaphelenchus xylophilus]
MSSLRVNHCKKGLKFFLDLAQGNQATLEYRQLKPNVIDIYHTQVPPELKGKGITAQLCKEAFNYAKENKLKVVTSCPTAQKYIESMASEAEKKTVVRELKDKKDLEDS